jgi:hypothetical protein
MNEMIKSYLDKIRIRPGVGPQQHTEKPIKDS